MELYNDELYKIKLTQDSKYIKRTYSSKMSMNEAKKYFSDLSVAIDKTKKILPIKEWQLRKGRIYELVPRYEVGQIRVDELISLITSFNKTGYTNTDIKKEHLGYWKDKLVFIKYSGIHKIKRNETLKDVEFLRQTLVDLIFKDGYYNEKGNYKAILKRHKHEEEFEKLPKLIEEGKFMQVYKEYIHTDYINADTINNQFDFWKQQPTIKNPTDQYLIQVIQQSPWLQAPIQTVVPPPMQPVQPVLQPTVIDPPYVQQPTPILDQPPVPGQPYGGAKEGGAKQRKKAITGKPSVMNTDSDHRVYTEYNSGFFLTNGEDTIIFNSDKEHGEDQFIKSETSPQTIEQDDEELDGLFIPGLIVQTQEKVKSIQYHKWYSKHLINALFPDYGFKLFLASYYGYDISAFDITNRDAKKVEFRIAKEPVQIDKIKQDQYFQDFIEAQQLFYNYCPRIEILPSILNRVLKVYDIQNYISNYKEIFDGTITSGGTVMMCQYNENFKGSNNFILKNFSIFPFLGNNTLGFLCQDDNQIQCQIVQYNKFYVIDIYHENDKLIDFQNDYKLSIKIEKLNKKVYQYIISFKEVDNFINNFQFLNPRKQSNTQYYFNICGKQISLVLRHKNIQCSGYFDNKWESCVYFSLVKNIGGFDVSTHQQPTLQNLQMIQPLYFGKTKISDYEKQLESMDKRPSVKFIQQFSEKDLPKYLDKFIVQNLTGGAQKTRKQQITIYDKDLSDDQFLKYQNQFIKDGVELITRGQNRLLSNKNQIYMNFICPEEYPYINPTYLNSLGKNDIVYIGCQQTPIKFNGINLYELYEAYKNILHGNEEFKEYLHKALFGRILINTIKFTSFTFITQGRCIQLLEELTQYFPSNLIMLKMLSTAPYNQLDIEWLNSVLSVDIRDYNIITYYYNYKLFRCQQKNSDNKYIIIVQQGSFANAYILLQPDLYNNKYQPYFYEGDIINEQTVKAHRCKNGNFIVTQDGILPTELFNNYLIIDTDFTEKWPSEEAIKKYINEEDIQNEIINSDGQLIGYKTKNDFNVYFKSSKKGKNNCVLGSYPNTSIQPPAKEYIELFYPTIEECAYVLIVNNRQLFIDNALNNYSKIRKELQYLHSKDEQKFIKYNNIIYFMKAPMTEKQVDSAMQMIKEYLPDNQEQLETYINNVSCYFKYSLNFNYLDQNEQIAQISAYQQAVDEIFFQ